MEQFSNILIRRWFLKRSVITIVGDLLVIMNWRFCATWGLRKVISFSEILVRMMLNLNWVAGSICLSAAKVMPEQNFPT
jgi:hypothetical protein